MPLIAEIFDECNVVAPGPIALVLERGFDLLPDAPDGDWAMTVRITTPEHISDLHGQFFGDFSDTDVMSFPSGDDLSAGGGYLGDVAISCVTAAVQARDHGHPVGREVAFLALHGLLHLLGYDDATADRRTVMLSRQTELLEIIEASETIEW